MFAGPNGSGKSTLNTVLEPELLGVYLNPDELERHLKAEGSLNLEGYRISCSREECADFLKSSQFLQEAGHGGFDRLRLESGKLFFPGFTIDSYLASTLVAFIREKLIEEQQPLTLETVMSHPSKVALLKEAQAQGYRTYLYYVATEDPDINISRVKNRVSQGGHPVPEEKIVSRYHRSLNLLWDAIAMTNRTFIFDNSTDGDDHTWIAEITEGSELELKVDDVPAWFRKSVIDRIPS